MDNAGSFWFEVQNTTSKGERINPITNLSCKRGHLKGNCLLFSSGLWTGPSPRGIFLGLSTCLQASFFRFSEYVSQSRKMFEPTHRGDSVYYSGSVEYFIDNEFVPATLTLSKGKFKITPTSPWGRISSTFSTGSKFSFNARSESLRFFFWSDLSSDEKANCPTSDEAKTFAFKDNDKIWIFKITDHSSPGNWLDEFQDSNWNHPGMLPSRRRRLPPGATDWTFPVKNKVNAKSNHNFFFFVELDGDSWFALFSFHLSDVDSLNTWRTQKYISLQIFLTPKLFITSMQKEEKAFLFE